MKSIIGTEVEQVNMFGRSTSKVVVLSMDAGLEICRKLNEVIEHINKSENIVLDEKKLAEVLSQKQVTVFKEGGVVGFRTNQWIPVDKELPETDVAVLVTHQNGNVQMAQLSKTGNFVIFDEEYGWFRIPVTAWQPLPEPYQEEGEVNAM